MTTKPRKRTVPIYMGWRQLIDPMTNGPRMALVAIDAVGQAQLKERGYRVGDRVRCELKQPRHYGNHKFVHRVGTLARNQLNGYEDCISAHAAVKKLQENSGVCCDTTTSQVFDDRGRPAGTVTTYMPRSISYDEMPEEEFKQFRDGICEYIRATHWPSITVEQIAKMIELQSADQMAA